MRGYPGSKGAMGVSEQIISLMPPHDRYIEPFFGGGEVFFRKRPARYSIVADRDEGLMRYHAREPMPDTAYICADAFKLLPSLKLTSRDLLYLDPPYHPDTRSAKKLYNFELDDLAHTSLLAISDRLSPGMVMISGYDCPLYSAMLQGWHRHEFTAATRGGPRTETLWFNFAPSDDLHDVRFVGDGFRERERIKRKRNRWVSRFTAMPPAERAVIRSALAEADERRRPTSPAAALVDVAA